MNKQNIVNYYERKIRKLRQQAFDYELDDSLSYTSTMSQINTEMIRDCQKKLSQIESHTKQDPVWLSAYNI